MKRISLLAIVAALALPTAAHADNLALRLGLETPVYTHFSHNGQSGSYTVGDTFQPAADLLLEYYPMGLVGFGAELREGFAASGQSCVGSTCVPYSRTGTAIGPNVTFDFNPVPLYARVALPVHVEPSPVRLDLRGAGGLKVPFGTSAIALYIEAALDFPLAGDGVSAFDQQQLNVGAGLWFKF